MSDSAADSNLKSPLASLAAFAQSKGNLFPSFEQAVQSPVARRLPALFSKVSFDGRTAASSAAAPSSFKDGSDETNGMSGSGKSGGGDTVGVFVLSDETVCCGQIGNSDRFCTIVCAPGETRCAIKSHQVKAPVKPGYVYICAPATKKVQGAAFQNPQLSVDVVGDKLNDLQNSQLSIKAWNRVFSAFDNIKDAPLDELNDIKILAQKPAQAPFTAIKRKRAHMEEDEEPSRKDESLSLPTKSIQGSFESFSKEDDIKFKESWSQLISCLEILCQDFPQLRSAIKKTKLDLEIAIESVEGSVEMINIDIGNDPGIDQGHPVTSLWSGIQLASRRAQQAQELAMSQKQLITSIYSAQQQTSSNTSSLQNDFRNVHVKAEENATLIQHILTEMQSNLNPMLQKLIEQYQVGAGNTNLPLGDIIKRLVELETSQTSQLGGMFPNSTSIPILQRDDHQQEPPVHAQYARLEAELKSFSARYATLEDRLQSESVTVNGITFGSLRDTTDWVKANVPNFVPDGFHDIMTLLQTVTEPHIAFKDGMNETYMSQKVGYTSKVAAIIAHSFKLELPDIFGKLSVTSDKSFPLPAVKTQKQWNPNDGVSGVMRYTNENLVFQVESCKAIITHSYASSKAHDLAFLMLTEAHSYWTRLATWMNEFFLKLTIVSSCSTDEAWLLVTSCVRGMFRELRRVRLCAQNADAIPDKIVSTSYFLWGSLQAHRIMREFLTKNFEAHPSVTPIINMHLFQYRVPMSMFKTIKDKVGSLESTIKQLKSDIDRLKNPSNKKKKIEEQKES